MFCKVNRGWSERSWKPANEYQKGKKLLQRGGQNKRPLIREGLVLNTTERTGRVFSSTQLCPFHSKATGERGGSRPKAARLGETSSGVRMRKESQTAQGGAEL